MSVQWDAPKTVGQQHTVTEEGLHLFDNLSLSIDANILFLVSYVIQNSSRNYVPKVTASRISFRCYS